MKKVAVILTCFNRREKTINCINELYNGNKQNEYYFIVVDDNSTDGTKEALQELGISGLYIVEGNGKLYWNGGMHKGIEFMYDNFSNVDYVLLVNDDVDFYMGMIDRMVEELEKTGTDKPQRVLVGATCDNNGQLSYGGIIYGKGLKFDMISPKEHNKDCSTFNANCTLIPYDVMENAGNIDSYYTHSFGDFDLGFRINRAGVKINVYSEYVGECEDNPVEGSWMDPKLGIIKRIKLKESFKGVPFKDWFHYLYKNFGLGTAVIRSFTPYVKILLHK